MTPGFTETNALNVNVTTGTYAITLTSGGVFKSLNFTGFTGSWTTGAVSTNLYGDLTLVSGMTYTPNPGASTVNFLNTTGTATLTCAGKTLPPVVQNGAGGTVSLGSALLSSTYTLTAGTFDASTFDVSTGIFSSANSNTRTINMGSGTWSLSGATVVWNLSTVTGLTLNKGTANIVLTNSLANNTRGFFGGGFAYNTLTIGGGSETGTSVRIYDANTFDTLASTKTVAYTLTLPASTTTTVVNFNIAGTAGNLITLARSGLVAGTQATLSKASGTVNANYLSIQDSAATGGAVWNAGPNSTDAGNNTGWIFANAPGPLSIGPGFIVESGFAIGG